MGLEHAPRKGQKPETMLYIANRKEMINKSGTGLTGGRILSRDRGGACALPYPLIRGAGCPDAHQPQPRPTANSGHHCDPLTIGPTAHSVDTITAGGATVTHTSSVIPCACIVCNRAGPQPQHWLTISNPLQTGAHAWTTATYRPFAVPAMRSRQRMTLKHAGGVGNA